MAINEDKYINALLYFLKYCNNKFLGKTKLNKLFYYLDFVYYRDNGISITGDEYMKRPYGPCPVSLQTILNKANIQRKINIIEDKQGEHYELLDKSFDGEKKFRPNEIELFNKIVEKFRDKDTNYMVALTHTEAPWFYSEMNCKIDYNLSSDIDIL